MILISQESLIKKMKKEAAKVRIGSLRDVRMLEGKEKEEDRNRVKQGQLEKNDGSRVVQCHESWQG